MRIALAIPLLLLTACSGIYRYEPPSYVVRTGDTLYSIAFRLGLDHRELAAWNGLSDPNRISVGQRLALAPSAQSQAPASAPVQAARPPVAAPAPALRWRWPVEGTIVSRFGGPDLPRTGIGLAGTLGQNVRAAAGGRVVYAGSGLVDYGQLVIIQHNPGWLSAYGHNRRLLVSEGQVVEQGQTIAEMGNGPTREPRLHFEIRQNGNPVDPLRLLPASG